MTKGNQVTSTKGNQENRINTVNTISETTKESLSKTNKRKTYSKEKDK